MSALGSTTPDQRVEELLEVFGDDQACVAELLCDRHPDDAVAFRIVSGDRSVENLTFGELKDRSRRFAAALVEMGVGQGDRVATLMGKSADLAATLMGIWRLGAVHVPLFTAFAPPAIAFRLERSQAKVVVTDAGQRQKLAPGDDMSADAPWQVIVAGDEGGEPEDTHLGPLLDAADPEDPQAAAVAVGGDGEFVRLFTSGTTGNPKGVPVPVRAIAAFRVYFELGLGVEESDVFWNAADPGWAFGLYYGIVAPLAAGQANILLSTGFSAELTYWVLENLQVTNFAAAPTVFRVLRSDSTPVPSNLVLRRCSAAGEPLNPEIVAWTEKALGVAAHDTYGQTEHGMCIINGWHAGVARPLKDGSMGHPMPGWCTDVLLDDVDESAPAGTPGRVVIDIEKSPLMWFTHYVDEEEKTAERFSSNGRWYYTGDVATKDEEGYYFFSARDDDVIIMAGYRIGPVEVENALLSHPEVADAAAVGVPDELKGEALEAYVVVGENGTESDEFATELRQRVKQEFAAHAAPRVVHFIPEIPRTPSGKVQRFVLRERRGRDTGDE